MDIVTSDPIRTATLSWRPRGDSWALTLICKATFHLVPGVAELSEQQEDLNEDDNYWNDDPSRSLSAPSDLVPYKLRADVLLVGNAFTPRGEPARSVIARLLVGGVDKSIEACADRSWSPDGAMRDGPRVARVPLRYDRAGGGPETSNPIGMRPDAVDVYGSIAIPNLQPVGLHLAQRGEWVPPIGFGPIAPTWPGRIEKIPGHAAAWARAPRYDYPLPDGFNPRFFNAAPDDQQIATLRPDERLVLENLHPEHPRLVTSLPGLMPRAIVERGGAAGTEEINLVCDTLWLDSDRAICTLVWRGHITVAQRDPKGRITVTLVSMSAPAWGGAAAQASDDLPSNDLDWNTLTIAEPPLTENAGSSPALPFQFKAEGLPFQPKAEGLPFQPKAEGLPFQPKAEVFPFQPKTGSLPFQPPMKDAPPSAPPPRPAQPSAAPVPSAAPPPAPYMPPPLHVAPPPPPPAASASPPSSPWAFGAAKPLGEPPPRGPFVGDVSSDGSIPALADPAKASGASGALHARAVVDRSKRAVEASAARSTSAAPGREALTLLWLDMPKASAIVTRPRWVKLLSEPRVPDEPVLAPDDDDEEEKDVDYFAPPAEDPDDEPEDVKQRRWVSKILSRGEPTTSSGLAEAMIGATTKDGTLEPPIVLVSGDISFPYDAWETVKAMIIAATPAAVADKKLKDLLDGVQETARLPGIERSVSVAEGLITRVREGFIQSNNKLGAGWLDAQAERMLLEGRCYQKRALFGQTLLRCLLHMHGGEDLPTYLPEALSKELPLVQRMRARLVVEVHGQQDQYETHPLALRALSVGRLLSLDPQQGGAPGR